MKTPNFYNRTATPEEVAQYQRGIAMALALTFVPFFALVYTDSLEVLICTFVGLWALMNIWNYRGLIVQKVVDFILAGGDKK
jgi:vacuolar-type H+-ATPase subunit I/STV1